MSIQETVVLGQSRRLLAQEGLSRGRAGRDHPPVHAPADHVGAERPAGRRRAGLQAPEAIAKATDGNLGAHLATLEKAAYVTIEKDFVGKRPRTRAVISRSGRRAYQAHLQYLRDILAGVVPDEE
jgi:hypothetical protein